MARHKWNLAMPLTIFHISLSINHLNRIQNSCAKRRT
jgi:hypothetical protein